VAELPGLVLALADRYGPIRQVMLSSTAWDNRFRRLAFGAIVVRMGWFATMDPALLIATTDRSLQIDLLVVPPRTAAATAEQAMATAADPTNVLGAPAILAVRAGARATAGNGADLDPDDVWDNEGGHVVEGRAPQGGHGRPVAVSG
jgi:Family of unknown function (DUF5994)